MAGRLYVESSLSDITTSITEAKQFQTTDPTRYSITKILLGVIGCWMLASLIIPYHGDAMTVYVDSARPMWEGWGRLSFLDKVAALFSTVWTARVGLLHSFAAIKLYLLPILIVVITAIGGGMLLMFMRAELRTYKFWGIDLWKWSSRLGGLITDSLDSLPTIAALLLIMAFFDHPSLELMALALGVLSSAGVSRVLLLEVELLKRRDFIDCSIAAGMSWSRIIYVHILYKMCFPVMIRQIVSLTSKLILLELSFTYLAETVARHAVLYPEGFPSWGMMIFEGFRTPNVGWMSLWTPLLVLSLIFALEYISRTITLIRQEGG